MCPNFGEQERISKVDDNNNSFICFYFKVSPTEYFLQESSNLFRCVVVKAQIHGGKSVLYSFQEFKPLKCFDTIVFGIRIEYDNTPPMTIRISNISFILGF
jgi:hypothetical protein